MNSLCHKYLNQNILPFIGRDKELQRLRTIFRAFLEEGESKYVLLSGESGSGKTRLVREFEDRLLKEYGETCVIVHARYLESNVAALTPIVNGFEACLDQAPHIRQYLDRTASFNRHREPFYSSVQPNGTAQNERSSSEGLPEVNPPALQVLLDSLSEIAKRFPLVLVLEDVQNMDDLPVFDQFFLGLSGTAKLVVLTERHENMDRLNGLTGQAIRTFEHFIRELALREERISDVIHLVDFNEGTTGKLFQILFDAPPSDELLEMIHSRTEGRPLSLRTMLRQLVATSLLLYENGTWQEDTRLVHRASSPDVAEKELLARFQREIERLNTNEQIVAMHAALLGEQFNVRLLRTLLRHRLGDSISDEIFRRTMELLTFKSIIRPAVPSISFLMEDRLRGGTRSNSATESTILASSKEAAGEACYEFSHAIFWNTILESSRSKLQHEQDLIIDMVWIAGQEHLPLYSNAFLRMFTPPHGLTREPARLSRIEFFLYWSTQVVRSLWLQEPQQCLQFLLGVRPWRDEITWRFGAELSEMAMRDLLDLHTLLVEAFQRNGSILDAERDLEHAAVLERFIHGSTVYRSEFQAIVQGRVAALRAILHAGRTSYSDYERWSNEARIALQSVSGSDPERAYLLTLLNRTKAEALLNAGHFHEADMLIEAGMPVAQLLAESRFDEYSLYYRLAVSSKLKQDQNEQARELTTEIMAHAKEHGNALVETMFLFQAVLAAFGSGDLKAAKEYCARGIANGRRYGIRFVEIVCYLWRAIIASVEQDADSVKEGFSQLSLIVEDSRFAAQTPNLLHRISLLEGRATAMNFLGRYHAALEYSEEAIQLAGSHQHDSFAAWAQNEKALALIGLSRFEEALEVAQSCVRLAGEQRLAERTARTALILAFAGLGRFEEARIEVERIRNEFKERNPYFFRFALAECRLTRLLAGQTRSDSEHETLTLRLERRVEELVDLARTWQAPMLEELLRKEFDDILPARKSLENTASEIRMIEPVHRPERPSPTIRLLCQGTMSVEFPQVSNGDAMVPPTDLIAVSTGSSIGGVKRDTKVRQLLSILVMARVESSDMRRTVESRVGIRGTVDRERLFELLWPESDTPSTNQLYVTTNRARTLLGFAEAIEVNEHGYRLSDIVRTDCEEILEHYIEALQAKKRNALFSITFHYEQIVRLTDRGPLMEGIYGPWLEGFRTRVATLRRTAATRLIEIELERGLLDRAEEICLKLLREDEFDEEALRGLLVINAKRRQTTNLVRLYDEYSKKLKSEFRTEPSRELRTLYKTLIAQE